MALSDIRDAGRSDIEALTAAYVHALDDGALERWPDFFTRDCVYKVVPRENYENGLPLAIWYCEGRGMLQDRVTAIRETQLFAPRALRHVTGSLLILGVEGGALRAVTSYAVYESPLDRPSEVFNVGRYLDRIVLQDGRLKFAEKLCVYDTGSIPTSLIYPI